ncbi:MAG: hypothetical protein ACJ8DN_22480 [Microvirga sp.]
MKHPREGRALDDPDWAGSGWNVILPQDGRELRPPGFIVPCHPIIARAVPAGDGWLHELKCTAAIWMRSARRSG